MPASCGSRNGQMIRLCLFLTLVFILSSSLALAQQTPPKFDIFAGYQWLHPGGFSGGGVIGIGQSPIDETGRVIRVPVGGVGLNGFERPVMRLGELFRVHIHHHHPLERLLVARIESQHV